MDFIVFAPEVLRPYDPRYVPLPPPDTDVTDAPYVRLCINSKWVSHVDGILERLLYRDAWSGTDDVIEGAIGQVRILLALLGAQPTEDCDVMLQFRNLEDGCGFEFSTDGGSSWNTVSLTTCQGEQGEQGEQGIQGIQGIQGEKGDKGDPGECDGCQHNDAPQTNEINDTGRKVACAVADGVSQWLFDKFSDQLDLIAADVTGGVTLIRTINKAVDVVLQFTIVGDEALDAITEFVTGAVATGVATIRANDTTEFREAVKCYLFCLLVPTDGDFGTQFSDIVAPLVTQITAGQNPLIAVPFTAFIRGIDISAYRQRAVLNANNEGDCDACTDCPECPEATINLNSATPVTFPTVLGTNYTIRVSGLGNTGPFDMDAYGFFMDGSWQRTFEGSDVTLYVDGAPADIATPETSHIYEISYVGTGADVEILFEDVEYSDNGGTLHVEFCEA